MWKKDRGKRGVRECDGGGREKGSCQKRLSSGWVNIPTGAERIFPETPEKHEKEIMGDHRNKTQRDG